MDRIKVHVVRYRECKNLILRYRDPLTGKHCRKSSGTVNPKDARKAAARWEDELNSGKARGWFRIGWEEFRQRYEEQVLPGLAAGTASKVDAVFNTVEKTLPVVKTGLLRELTAERLSEMQTAMRKIGRAEATIASTLAHLRAAMAWAVDQGLMPEVPKMKRPKRARRSGGADPMKGRPITSEEFERMLAVISKALIVKAKLPHTARWEIFEPTPEAVESWRFLLLGLWWSGLRLGEALNLSWDDPRKIRVDLSSKRPMLHIPGGLQKSGKDQLYPLAPEFGEFLESVPEEKRRGFVFNPLSRTRGVVHAGGFVGRIIGKFGNAAGVKVRTDQKCNPETGKESEVVKYASAHDCRRAFGERWAARVMPQTLMTLMRHESIDTTMRYYVGRNAQSTADVVWEAYKKRQEGTVLGTVAQNEDAIMTPDDNLTPSRETTCKTE